MPIGQHADAAFRQQYLLGYAGQSVQQSANGYGASIRSREGQGATHSCTCWDLHLLTGGAQQGSTS